MTTFFQDSVHVHPYYPVATDDRKQLQYLNIVFTRPNIHIQILHTLYSYISVEISWESLIKDHSSFSLVIIWLILVTICLDNVWILLGEN